MRIITIITTIFVLFFSACNNTVSLSGQVVDAETGDPIEGAVVLVEWTMTSGLGLKTTKSWKVIEVLTDKDGRFEFSTTLPSDVDPPDLTIYKPKYVAWNNHMIFPEFRAREDFEWKDNYVFRMERFKDSYSYQRHGTFVRSAAATHMASEQKTLLQNAHREWEREKEISELSEINRNRYGEIND